MGLLNWDKLRAWIAECGALYCVWDVSDMRLTPARPVSSDTSSFRGRRRSTVG
jgi:hypothetical protein